VLKTFNPGYVLIKASASLIGLQPPKPANSSISTDHSFDFTNTNRASYGLSLLEEIKVASACEKFYNSHKTVPSSVSDFAQVGITTEMLSDAWGRPFKIRMFADNLLVVQSLGPSGVDAISSQSTSKLVQLPQAGNLFIDDNLLVYKRL
jgi:hypothetical protein